MLQMSLTKSLIASAVIGGLAATAQAADGPEWSFGGYVKFDAMVSKYGDGPAGPGTDNNVGRQFYIPGLTPVGGASDDPVTDFHARQSRFWFDVAQQLDNGEKITGRIELDFLTVPSGDERVTNSYAPRLRQAYLQYQHWLVGQAWSNFQDLSILPESVDFVGVPDGIIFMRQPQVRYTRGAWSFSLENPETTVSNVNTLTGGVSRITKSQGYVPDFTVKYKDRVDNFSYTVAAIARQLVYDIDDDGSHESTAAFGVTVAGKYLLDNGNDIRASFSVGSGLGRYLALNTYNGAYISSNGSLEALDVMGLTLAYRHHWTEKTRSSFVYARGWADNEDILDGTLATDHTQRFGVNLMHSIDKKLSVGAEISLAQREVASGLDGDLTRLQLMAMYSF